MSRMVSFFVLVGIIVALGLVFLRVMAVFLLPLFLAALLVVMFRPLHLWFLTRYPGRPKLSAGLTTGAVILTVLLPMAALLTLAVRDILALQHAERATDGSVTASAEDDSAEGIASALRSKLGQVRRYFDLDIPNLEELRYIESSLDNLAARAAVGAMSNDAAIADTETLVMLHESLREFAPSTRADADVAADPETDHDDSERPRSADSNRLGDIAALMTAIETAREAGPGRISYQARISDAVREFRSFKVELLGGELSMRLKELANPTEAQLQRLADRAFAGAPGWLRAVGGKTGVFSAQLIFGLVVTVIAVYFFLADGPTMVTSLMRLSPLDDRHERELLDEFDRTSRAVVVATLLTAVVQGALAGIGFFIVGFWADGLHGVVFLLTLTTVVFALIPFIGAASVWVPVCLWLLFTGHPLLAVVLAGYGLVISTSDNVIKPIVLHGQSNLHPLLALLSVLGGVQALGPIGVLIGPMVVVFLQTLLNILHRELMSLERGEQEDAAG